MNITAVCVTFNRPAFLGRAIHCFEQQDDKSAGLLVLDDGGQYASQGGDRWVLVSRNRRYETLGDKRNAAVRLACEVFPQTEGIAIWDDDDVYWPYACRAIGAALEKGPWARPSVVYEPVNRDRLDELRRVRTFCRTDANWISYGGSWGWRIDAFLHLGGYPTINNAEDHYLAKSALKEYGPSTDVICDEFPEPHYLYHRRTCGEHMSDHLHSGYDPYEYRGLQSVSKVDSIPIGWNGPDCYQLPVLDGINPRPW